MQIWWAINVLVCYILTALFMFKVYNNVGSCQYLL